MCVDYTDLSKSYSKDAYSLPRIDKLVDSAVGEKLLTFMDVYSGYDQIKMHPLDEKHTTFYTNNEVCCYEVMPFELKNAGATYQRLVNRMLAKQLGRNVEAYVDNMIVKSPLIAQHCADLEGMFVTLRKY
ncbi:hypothetical protein CRG98_004795 [Punica granatum]|uniref:Reverse transcriptase domain-containing protein n=1 Tax=Punica granatum TaxID=22663 RepID=A0A2I0L246_PUNGR|nr:hypothetical protein CRG98_004795 [Punica granatum]